MTRYKVLLLQLLISVAICSRSLQNTDAQRIWNRLHYNRTTAPQISSYDSLNQTSKDKVKLKVYYETLCPASVDFLASQLNPAVKRLGSHLEVDLIPYGHAKTFGSRGHYTFICQHGPTECYRNMVHACAIDVLRNNTHAALFNSCIMQYNSYDDDYKYFVSVLRWCGYTENVHIYEIWKCVNSRRGPNLLKEYGDETMAISPNYVPYLILDESTEHQNEATVNLFATICYMLSPKPAVCLIRR